MEKAGMKKISRTAKKKKRARLLLFIAISLIAVVLAAVVFNLIFRIETLNVVNKTEYSDEELLSSAGISKGVPLLFLQKEKINEKVCIEKPYVENVIIDRDWPQTVNVTFEAAVPRYEMEISDGAYIIVSEGMKALSTSSLSGENLIPVKGITVDNYEVGKKISGEANIEIGLLNEITGYLKDYGLYTRLSGVDFSKKHNYIIILDGNITVQLGSSEDLDKKTDKLKDILDRNADVKYSAMDISVRDYRAGRCVITE